MEKEEDGSIPITGCNVIAFPRDEHSLLGIYPPILNYSSDHAISGLARDGYMEVLHATYSREMFRDAAKAGQLILFTSPQETPPDPIVVCMPTEEAHLFEGVLEIQHAAKHPEVSLMILPLNGSLSHLMRCVRKNVPPRDIPRCVNLISVMISTQVLHEPDRLSFHLQLVHDSLLRNPQAYEEACALARRYLRRFHLPTPKELIPTP